MARNRFTKLNLGPMTEARHRSVAGSIIIADYIDPTNSQRTLVLERAQVDKKAPAKPRKPKTNTSGQSAAQSVASPTAFPGAGESHGA